MMNEAEKPRMAVRGVARAFRDRSGVVPVLRDVSFEVRAGEVLAIVGPSGCGKTTLLRVLGGLLRPNAGRVLLDQEEIEGPSDKISYMFQEDSLLPWKTAVRNVSLALEVSGNHPQEALAKAREYLELVELRGFEEFYPHQLSGGMKQRVALARALVTQPEILLMDEPLASLDPELRETLQEEIARIRLRLNCTIVLVSHDVDEIVYLSDRALLLSRRPASICGALEIALPERREALIRAKPEFAEVRAELWRMLRKPKNEAVTDQNGASEE